MKEQTTTSYLGTEPREPHAIDDRYAFTCPQCGGHKTEDKPAHNGASIIRLCVGTKEQLCGYVVGYVVHHGRRMRALSEPTDSKETGGR